MRQYTRSATGTIYLARIESGRPPLLRVLPPGTGRCAIDLRRSRADRRRSAIVPLLAEQRQPVPVERARTVFYSISNTQRGLSGISTGSF